MCIRDSSYITDARDGDSITNFNIVSSSQVCSYIAAHSTLNLAIPQTPLIQNACFAVLFDGVRGSETSDGDIVFGQASVLSCFQLSRKCGRVVADDQIDVAVVCKYGSTYGNSFLSILLAVVVVCS